MGFSEVLSVSTVKCDCRRAVPAGGYRCSSGIYCNSESAHTIHFPIISQDSYTHLVYGVRPMHLLDFEVAVSVSDGCIPLSWHF